MCGLDDDDDDDDDDDVDNVDIVDNVDNVDNVVVVVVVVDVDNNDDVAVVPQKKTHTPLCCACATGSTQLAERREANSAAAQSMQSPHRWGYHNFHTN